MAFNPFFTSPSYQLAEAILDILSLPRVGGGVGEGYRCK